MHAGEAAKCRQDTQRATMGIAQPEARQAQTVARASAERDARVPVARQNVSPRDLLRMVAQRQTSAVLLQQQWLVDHPHTERGRRITGAVIVVATHQGQLQTCIVSAPVGQRLLNAGLLRPGRMQKVA